MDISEGGVNTVENNYATDTFTSIEELMSHVPGFQPIDVEEIGIQNKEKKQVGSFRTLGPANGAYEVSSENVALTWEGSEGASNYELIVAEDEKFEKIVLHEKLISNFRLLSKLKSGGGGTVMSSVANTIYDLEPPAPTVYFDDIEQAEWAKDAISKLAELKIVNGKADKAFAPNDQVTREEFVAIVVRAFEITENSKDIPFEDVLSDSWYYDTVKKAYNSGIVTGIDDKTFGVCQFITRQDMAVIISRAVTYSAMELYPIYTDKELNDMENIADYASSAVSKMVKAGVIKGYEDGSFKPQNQVTRAQAAKIIYSILFE